MVRPRKVKEEPRQTGLKQLVALPLKEEVKQALLESLRDDSTPQSARVSAARTLLEYFVKDDAPTLDKRGAELTAAELDAAIDKLGD